MDDLLRSQLLANQQHPDSHPDADALAALGEGTLRKDERDSLLAHLAGCSECRQVVALASSIQRVKPEVAAARPVRTLEWKVSRWAVVPTVCLLALLLMRRPHPGEASIPLPSVKPPVPVIAPATVQSLKPLTALKTKRSAKPKGVPASEPMADLPRLQVALPEATQGPPIQSPTKQSLPSRSFGFLPQSNYASNRVVMTSLAPQGDTSLWRITIPAGMLQKSNNNGSAWQEVRVDSGAPFLALAARRKDVWVASADRKLFHSTDNGLHWNPVAVRDAGVALTGAITRIDASDERNVEVNTTSGEHWVSNDEGFHWRRQ